MNDSARTQELIRAVEQADSAPRLLAAVQALADARIEAEAGITTLIAALGYNNPAAAVVAVQGLIQLGEAAVPLLVEKLDGYNYGARAYAIRALATIADPRALEVLLTSAATDFAPSVRRAATKGLGSLHWSKLSPEQIQPAKEKALETLLQVATDPDWSLRYAAVVGLQALSDQPDVRSAIASQIAQMAQSETDLAVRARVILAQQHSSS